MAKRNEKPTISGRGNRQVTLRINNHFLDRLEKMGLAIGRTRSEMIDRAIEEYVLAHEQSYLNPKQPGQQGR